MRNDKLTGVLTSRILMRSVEIKTSRNYCEDGSMKPPLA